MTDDYLYWKTKQEEADERKRQAELAKQQAEKEEKKQ